MTVKPDLILIKNRKAVAVTDVKYKLLDDQGRFPNADAYQLLAYCTRLGLDRGHLIYAAGEPQPAPIKIIGSTVRIHTHTLDLRCSSAIWSPRRPRWSAISSPLEGRLPTTQAV